MKIGSAVFTVTKPSPQRPRATKTQPKN